MNDETEKFEQRLNRLPLRAIPAEWQAEILSATQAAVPAQRSTKNSWLSTLNSQLSTPNSQLPTTPLSSKPFRVHFAIF